MTVHIHVVGFAYSDWCKRVPTIRDITLDVREFIERDHSRKNGVSALYSKEIRKCIFDTKGCKNCIKYLLKEIHNKLSEKMKL